MIGVTLKYGQLGNNLMAYANIIAVAEEHGLTAIYPAFYDYAPEFVGTADNPLCRYPALHICKLPPAARRFLFRACASVTDRIGSKPFPMVTRVSVAPGTVMDANAPAFIAAARRRIVLTDGWAIHNAEMVVKHSDKIRAYFQPVEKYRSVIADTVANARRDCDLLIGVHIRKSDFKTYAGGKYYWSDDQYAERLRDLSAVFPDRRLHFLICSDEPISPLLLDAFTAFPGPGSMIGDLYSLAGCDYIIGTPSTFARWAAFYGKVPAYLMSDVKRPIIRDDFINFESPNYHSNESVA